MPASGSLKGFNMRSFDPQSVLSRSLVGAAMTCLGAIAAASEDFRWVQYVPGGIEARVITGKLECPVAAVDGAPIVMSKRSMPGENYPILVCAVAVPAAADGATIDGMPLSLPRGRPNRILVIGDTGCRIQIQRNQNCNNAADWPFRLISETSAGFKPDLVLHVGDYVYRESACSAGNLGCAGSPFGDTWDVWRADFFSPSEKLLTAAPWIFVRGNREECRLGGKGWGRILDPHPWAAGCPGPAKPFTVDLGGLTLVVMDVSTADDAKPNETQVAMYKAQFASVADLVPKGPVWLTFHRPIWALNAIGDNKTLAAAANGSLTARVQALISGHIHTFAVMSYVEELPIQIVSGNGGDILSVAPPEIVGIVINGMTVKAGISKPSIWGFSMLEREQDEMSSAWTITSFDAQARILARCKLEGRNVFCS